MASDSGFGSQAEQTVPDYQGELDPGVDDERYEPETDTKISVVLAASQRARIERLMRFRVGLSEMDAATNDEIDGGNPQRGHIANLQLLVSSFENEIERYAKLEAENARLRKEMEQLARELQKERRFAAEKEDRQSVLLKRLEEVHCGLQEAHCENSQLSTQLTAWLEREETLKKRVHQLKDEVIHVQEERDRLRQDYGISERNLFEATSRVCVVQTHLEEERLQNAELNRLVEEGAASNDLLQHDLDDVRDQVFALNSEKVELVGRIEALNKSQADASSAHARELRKKNSEINRLLAELDIISARSREQGSSLTSLEQRCKSLEKALSEQEKLTAKSHENFNTEIKGFEAERKRFLQHAQRIASHEEKIAKLSASLSQHQEGERLATQEVKELRREQAASHRKIKKLEAVEVRYEKLKAEKQSGKPDKPAMRKNRRGVSKA